MKLTRNFLIAALIIAATLPAAAKKSSTVTKKVYMFGLAASFNDTIVHFTEIQGVDSVQLNRKNKFLKGREIYSNMLRNYLQENNMPFRTCIVFYDQKLGRLQKKYLKTRKLYRGNAKKGLTNNDIRDIAASDFKFSTVRMAEDTVEETTAAQEKRKDPPTPKKEKNRKEHRGK